MKSALALLCASAALAGCAPGDEYGMSRKDAYLKLARLEIEPSQQAPFIMLDQDVRGNGLNEVNFGATPDAPGFGCLARLTELAPDSTKVTLTCHGAAGDGASNGMAHNMLRNRLIELIDATLNDRAYNPSNAGSTASRWPGDGVDGSIGGAMGQALKMDADTRRDLHEMKMQEQQDEAEKVVSQPDSAEGTDPNPPSE
jgi:hypothetical protein